MMVATFNGNPRTIIISWYSPTNASDERDLLTFYNKLSSIVCGISKNNVLIIIGDMNTLENGQICLVPGRVVIASLNNQKKKKMLCLTKNLLS